MAITAVPSSQVAQGASARAAVPSGHSPEPTRTTQPSAITRISEEGKLRAEQDRQQVAVATSNAALNKVNTVSQATAVPHRTPIEEATDVAAIAAAAVQAPNPNLPPRELSNAQPVEQVVKAVASDVRREPQAEREPSQAPRLEGTQTPAPALSANSVATPLPARPLPDSPPPNRAQIEPPRANRNEAAPANKDVLHVAHAPTEKTPVEKAPVTNTSTTENRVNHSRISQTAHDLVAAFNHLQSQRSQAQERSDPASQALAANTSEPRNAAPNSARIDTPEVGGARADTSTFAVGVVRNSAAPVQGQSQGSAPAAVTRAETSDIARNARTPVVRDEQSRTPAPVSSRTSAPAETISQIQAHATATTQRVQNERQNIAAASPANQAGGASEYQGGGFAKHLNALANLITP